MEKHMLFFHLHDIMCQTWLVVVRNNITHRYEWHDSFIWSHDSWLVTRDSCLITHNSLIRHAHLVWSHDSWLVTTCDSWHDHCHLLSPTSTIQWVRYDSYMCDITHVWLITRHSGLMSVAVCCSVMQCVAVCCSVLHNSRMTHYSSLRSHDSWHDHCCI